MATDSSANPHPVTYFVTPQMEGRNRLTCAFRIILAIPHLIIVGGPGGIDFGLPAGIIGGSGRFVGAIGNGVLGALAVVMAIVSWFAIVFTGSQPRGLWDLTNYYLRWRSKAVAYVALLRDEYPPFGDGEYPVDFGVGEFPEMSESLVRRSANLLPDPSSHRSLLRGHCLVHHGDHRLVCHLVHRGVSRRPLPLRGWLPALVPSGGSVCVADARRVPAIQPGVSSRSLPAGR